MIFKIMAFVAAAIPIFLFVRSTFSRRPTRLNEGFKELRRSRFDLSAPHCMCRDLRRWQADLAVALNQFNNPQQN
jgi:hypothetical protein